MAMVTNPSPVRTYHPTADNFLSEGLSSFINKKKDQVCIKSHENNIVFDNMSATPCIYLLVDKYVHKRQKLSS